MRTATLCGLLVAGAMLLAGERAEAWGRRGCYYVQPQVIYVVPAQGGYYYPGPAAPRTPAPKQGVQQRNLDEEGTFYFTPGGSVSPTSPAAPLTPAYPSPVESFEYGQPEGWWWR